MDRTVLQASQIDVIAFGKAPWYGKRQNAADSAEPVHCHPGLKGVFFEVIFPLERFQDARLYGEAEEACSLKGLDT